MQIVFATAEIAPIAKTGGLGDVCGSLPRALVKLGHEVTLFMPFYRQARQWLENHQVIPDQPFPAETLRWATWSAEVTYLRTTLPGTDIPLILVANDHFFDRASIYEAAADGVDDFLLRYTFFCRAVIRGCELFDVAPEILHCHDWHTALLPVYLDSGLRNEARFANTRSVYTIHNLNYQGAAGAEAFSLAGLHARYWRPDALEHFGQINPMKGGIIFADRVTTVSPTYAREVQTPEFGAGLDGVLRSAAPKFSGILNGIDVDEWDPASDPLLRLNFDAETLEVKAKNKRALVKEAGLPFSAKKPLLTAVSRLVDQKGFQLLLPVIDRVVKAGAQLLILGSGEPDLERQLATAAERHPESCRVIIGFDNAFAHRIYAGADLMLMPSLYEPCGLNQMYALRYGTVPVVRLTGGLVDTVTPYDGTNIDEANGFGFIAAHSLELYLSTWLAMLNFRDAPTWRRLRENGMESDFSWTRSALQYDRVYRSALADPL